MSAAEQPLETSDVEGAPVRHALRRLGVYLRRNWRYYGVWFIGVVLYTGIFNAIPLTVGWAVDGLIDADTSAQTVIERCWLLFGLAIAGGVLRFFTRQLVFDAAREVEYEIRNDIFDHLQKQPQSFYFKWRTGDLMSRCVNDLNSVRLLLGPGLLSVAQSPILFIGAFIAMSTFSVKLAALMVIPYPLFIVISRVIGAHLFRRSLAAQQSLASMSNLVQESIAGIGVVKAYAMERDQAARFAEVNDHLRERQLGLVRAGAAMPAMTGLLPAAGLGMVLYAGLGEIARGDIGAGALFAFTIYARVLTFPTMMMGYSVSLLQRGASAMQRIDEILSVEPAIADREDSLEIEDLAGEIEFRGLSFGYGDDKRELALRDLVLKVPAGSSLGVVGPVGSGKSTLAGLIPRLHEVEEGQLFIDGVDVNRIRLSTLRSAIAMVPQDSFLFSLPLHANIAYGLAADAPREQIETAAARAQLAADVKDLPQGFDTLVGERGVMLSGGQRQRTALARALALDPRILILDDTLSAVDAETELRIQAELAVVFAGRTVVVVASRVNSVRELDQIVVLDEGRMVERGSHDELIALGGLYARLAVEQEEEVRREVRSGAVLDANETIPVEERS
ncbi:MAG: ABC transporter ATP-binding protein [bacterium]|nr:ABC transporter ATP-binding protein [bacterium]